MRFIHSFIQLAAHRGFEYFAFHDVDMIPIAGNATLGGPLYTYVSNPTHLATAAQQFGWQLPYDTYVGGVLLMNTYALYYARVHVVAGPAAVSPSQATGVLDTQRDHPQNQRLSEPLLGLGRRGRRDVVALPALQPHARALSAGEWPVHLIAPQEGSRRCRDDEVLLLLLSISLLYDTSTSSSLSYCFTRRNHKFGQAEEMWLVDGVNSVHERFHVTRIDEDDELHATTAHVDVWPGAYDFV